MTHSTYIKLSLLLILIILPALPAKAQRLVYEKSDSIEIVTLLKDAPPQLRSAEYVLHFAKALAGKPYHAHTLDKTPTENLVVNMRGLDCCTFVEVVTALTLCREKNSVSFADFCNNLRKIRYLDGEVAYHKRKHYFTTWAKSNVADGLLIEVPVGNACNLNVKHKTVSLNYMSRHTEAYKMLSGNAQRIEQIKQTEEEYSGSVIPYIPKQSFRNSKDNAQLCETVRDGDIIAIVTNKNGLDVSHLGIASWHSDGLHLINASSIHKKVIDEPMLFYDYMQKHTSQVGAYILRCR